ncbi:MAG: LLM class F420-dependent oxidoreductase [Sciscionella sp.]
MRLGVSLGYALGRDITGLVAYVRAAEDLGYSVAWAAEAYGSDTVSVLGYLAACTQRIDLGAGVLQIPARSPAMTAMTAASLDLLSGGRFRLGLGVSGPQVSEGWHGVRFGQPLARTREYVEVVRCALDGQLVRHDGRFYPLPLPDGPGKALKLGVHPVRPQIPVYLAAMGPRNLELTGEVADGWLAIFLAPDHAAGQRAALRRGRARAGRSGAGFDIAASVAVAVGPDVAECADAVRPYAALYVGGMGSRELNFYNRQATAMGYEKEAAAVQDSYLAGRHREAMAALPMGFLDATSLLGPRQRVVDRLHEFAAAGVTTLTVTAFGSTTDERVATLRAVAEALDESGLGD